MTMRSPTKDALAQNLPPLTPGTTRIVLVRHGRSTANDQQRYQGSSDEAVLTDQGWQQASLIGELLRNIPIDVVYSSPLRRARQTVEGLFAALQPATNRLDTAPAAVGVGALPSSTAVAVAPPRPAKIPQHIHPALREIHLPAWEGRLYREVRAQEAEAYRCWIQRPHEFQMASGGGVSYPVLDLYRHAQLFWREVLPRHQGQTLLVVGHGGTNHALISTALGLSPAQHHRLQQSHGGVSVLDYTHATGTAQLQLLNVTRHLGESLPKLKAGKQGVRVVLLPLAASQSLALVERACRRLDDSTIAYGLIQACSTTGNITQLMAQYLRHHRPDILQFPIQGDFSTRWCAALKQMKQAAGLTTALAIAPPATIHRLATTAIGLPIPGGLLNLMSGHLSLLHYPTGDHPPILQATNLD
ncbi:MAG: histidine phosphatase family protein [Cyanobacteria bacterium P01_A01_bin.135]